MDKSLDLALRINGNQAAAEMRKFANSAVKGLGDMRKEVNRLWQDFNGFSTATKLFAAAGGLETVRRTLLTNLNFERDLLEMKQNAGMTIK
ncbi:hypothetical protein [Methylomonas koyamae]|uniref:Uncharacterized protein n=1 Tax=Methylomonas koyamae TaxID=702114 RepID=A0A291IG40_9GAMM|nr:hypothetical protein [Methylomonas koyamae]ATG89117.1 hypothetical protein MKLM6_0845 [Methylomonas koyamae]OAI24570.1 hypothetical protein A1356_15535 [Methylomonas koyamae]